MVCCVVLLPAAGALLEPVVQGVGALQELSQGLRCLCLVCCVVVLPASGGLLEPVVQGVGLCRSCLRGWGASDWSAVLCSCQQQAHC